MKRVSMKAMRITACLIFVALAALSFMTPVPQSSDVANSVPPAEVVSP